MNVIAVIPARKGSKSIKNKNIIKINKKSLIEYTFTEVEKSILKKSFILTDSQKIKNIAKKYKINNDYIRPKKLSQDKTSLLDNLTHFYKWLNIKKINFDYF